jgi:hypothetical protein
VADDVVFASAWSRCIRLPRPPERRGERYVILATKDGRILGLHRRDMHHAPHVPFAMVKAHQHGQQLAHVQPITLGPTLATIDRNRGGIHPMVGEALRLPIAMQPEAFTPRFIATHHRRAFGSTKAFFGLRHFLEHARLVTRCDTPLTWFLTVARGATELPGLFTQCKRHKEDALRCGIMGVVGRCRHGLSPPW